MTKKRTIKVGEIYGDLKVIEDCGFDETRHQYYKCICIKCNKESRVSRAALIKNTPKCMVCKGRTIHQGMRKDGYIVLSKKRNEKVNIWVCKCEKCNRKVELRERDIMEGKVPKCKCIVYPGLQKSYIDQIF